MALALDHLFVCTTAGAPMAERLAALGLTEGTPNRHPGQGTACRRFFFHNFMLELLWVADATEAQSLSQARQMKLWERWSGRERETCPFGIIVRPDGALPVQCPFPSWEYRPASMPDLVLHVASDTGLEEPMWGFLATGRAPLYWPVERRQPLHHEIGFRRVSGVRLAGPELPADAVTRHMAGEKLVSLDTAPEHWAEVQFDDGQRGLDLDLRPELPLLLRW